jgi:hypothetical protein
MELIGLAGPARSGKDTVADILEETTEGTVERDGFSVRLKLIAARALGISAHPDDVGMKGILRWADRFKEQEALATVGPRATVTSEISGREFLQRLGTEGIRSVLGEDILIRAVPLERDCDLLVITDVRFPDEAEAIRKAGGEVWRLFRPGTGRMEHLSERSLPAGLVDREIDNSGTIADLYETVRGLR